VRPAAVLAVAIARLNMFEFVVIVEVSLLKRSARGAGDGVNIRRPLCAVKHFFQKLFRALIPRVGRGCVAARAAAILWKT
jgi:hypothetical protein